MLLCSLEIQSHSNAPPPLLPRYGVRGRTLCHLYGYPPRELCASVQKRSISANNAPQGRIVALAVNLASVLFGPIGKCHMLSMYCFRRVMMSLFVNSKRKVVVCCQSAWLYFLFKNSPGSYVFRFHVQDVVRVYTADHGERSCC